MAIPGYKDQMTVYPGLGRTTGGIGGDTPQQTIQGYTTAFYKRLYKSPREVALILDKTFKAGYGCLPIGTVLAEALDASGDGTGYLIPYVPANSALDTEEDYGRVFLAQDNTSATATDFVVDVYESYKISVGDEIVITDDDTVGDYLGPQTVSAISRGTTTATITIDTAVDCDTSNMLVTNNANLYVKADTASHYSDAKYILDMEVDTGAGADAKGGIGAVLVSNAIVYQDAVIGMDSAAITDLSIVSDGAYYILK